jgi:copper chaperone
VATVTPHLNGEKDITKWEVDTVNPDKILTIEAEHLNENQLRNLVEKAGFKAEKINS